MTTSPPATPSLVDSVSQDESADVRATSAFPDEKAAPDEFAAARERLKRRKHFAKKRLEAEQWERPLTQMGVAERILEVTSVFMEDDPDNNYVHGGIIVVKNVGFFVYDHTTGWRHDEQKLRVGDIVHGFIRDAYNAACSAMATAPADTDEELKALEKADAEMSFYRHSQTANFVSGVITTMERMAPLVDAEDLDADERLMEFTNGTLDLKTLELREHRPNDYITRRMDVAWNPDAECPLFRRFLAEVQPEEDMQTFLQTLVGYGITGSTAEQVFGVFYGTGANGKSVFTDTLSHIFGPITETTPFDTFLQKNGTSIPADLAALRGARLVMATEGPIGARLNESMLKRLTGQDEVSARFMRENFFSFHPKFLLLLATNHRPTVRGQDEGLWRRFQLIGWNTYIPPEKRDRQLTVKLREEAEGIAVWAAEGAARWYAEGLKIPQSITDATEEFRAQSDPLMGFDKDRLVAAVGKSVPLKAVHEAFVVFYEDNGGRMSTTPDARVFAEMLRDRGIETKRRKQGYVLVDYVLAVDDTKQGQNDADGGSGGPSVFKGVPGCTSSPSPYGTNSPSGGDTESVHPRTPSPAELITEVFHGAEDEV